MRLTRAPNRCPARYPAPCVVIPAPRGPVRARVGPGRQLCLRLVWVVPFEEGTAVLAARKAEPCGRPQAASLARVCARLCRWLCRDGRMSRGSNKRIVAQTRKGSTFFTMALRATSSLRATAMMPTLAWPDRATTLR